MLIVIFSLKNWLDIPGKHQTKIKLQKLFFLRKVLQRFKQEKRKDTVFLMFTTKKNINKI